MNYQKPKKRRQGRHSTPRQIRAQIRDSHSPVAGFWVGAHFWQRLTERRGVVGIIESMPEAQRILSGDFFIQPKGGKPPEYEYRNGKCVFIVKEIEGMKVVHTIYIKEYSKQAQ
ncbi:hypothetical protein L6279_01925 [Candidatus Parcubacteria bacterium]|nr:hypothetical protein [Candidatus Parcubacteria bacterium]